jgi:hypothetical protein
LGRSAGRESGPAECRGKNPGRWQKGGAMTRKGLPILGIALLLGMFASPVWADDFQLVDRATGGWVSYAEVFGDDRRLGYTDKYGRIRINLPPGRYRAEVRVNGDTVPFSFEISDEPDRRRMTVIRLDIRWD